MDIRPQTIVCPDCGEVVKVEPLGRVPKRCKRHTMARNRSLSKNNYLADRKED